MEKDKNEEVTACIEWFDHIKFTQLQQSISGEEPPPFFNVFQDYSSINSRVYLILLTTNISYNIPKDGMMACNRKEITFVDGTKQGFDLVIMPTGYR